MLAAGGLLAAGLGQASLAAASCGPDHGAAATAACSSGGSDSAKIERLKTFYDKTESAYHTTRGAFDTADARFRETGEGWHEKNEQAKALYLAKYKLAKAEDALFQARNAGRPLTPEEEKRAAARTKVAHSYDFVPNTRRDLVDQLERSANLVKSQGDAATPDDREMVKRLAEILADTDRRMADKESFDAALQAAAADEPNEPAPGTEPSSAPAATP